MKASVGVRALAIAAAAGSLLAVPFATSASAASQPASCGVLTTKIVGTKVVITESKCLPTSATGGGGSATTSKGTGKSSGKTINTITWAAGHGTTKSTISYVANPKGKGLCPSGTTRLTITGKVLSSTGKAAAVIKAGQAVTASVCTYLTGPKTGQSSLEKGTVEKL